MRKAVAVLALMASMDVAGVNAAELIPAANGYHKQKVVYHINDAQVSGMALRNIQNHINAVGAGNADVVVVTHGPGIDFLLDGWKDAKGNSHDTMIHDLSTQGVAFKVCNNTLVGRKIDPDMVNMNADVVPSGVATVAELQLNGFVYIKP
ncbi:MAG: DsrE family protein [Gammaproteobacteria bacterium]|nr:DsrE family protein [Gammaproteobacteria bacterium]